MKLHLPLFLHRALAACRAYTIGVGFTLGATCICLPAQADKITLSEPTSWKEDEASGYTGLEGDWYSVQNTQWAILSGSYTISSLGTPNLYAAIILNTTSLENNGNLTVTVPSTTTNGVSIYGIRAWNKSSIANNQEGILAISATSEDSGATGMELFSTPLTNSGEMTIAATSQGIGNVHAIQVETSSSSLTNSGAMELTAQAEGASGNAYGVRAEDYAFPINNLQSGTLTIKATSANGTAYGIYSESPSYSLPFTNSGLLTITAESAGSGSTGIYKHGGEITNEEGALMKINVTTTGDSVPINQKYCSSLGIYLRTGLQNLGTMEITATATGAQSDACGISGYNNSSKLNNSGKMTITVEASTGNASGFSSSCSRSAAQINSGELTIATQAEGSSYGVQLYESSLENEQGGILTINSTSSANGAYGIHGYYSASVTNSGRITATAKANGNSYGVFISELHNELEGMITATAVSTGSSTDTYAAGLYLLSSYSSSPHTNDGEITATAQSTVHSTGISMGACSLTNAQGGVLTAQATSTENTGRSTGFLLTTSGADNSSFINYGEVTTSAQTKGDSYGIRLAGSTLSNDHDGFITATATSLDSNYTATGIEIATHTAIPSMPPSFELTHHTASLGNCGDMSATASSAGDSYGIRLSGSALTNELEGIITTRATTTSANGAATGISMGAYTYTPTSEDEETLNFVSSLTNRGVITAIAQSSGNSCGILLSNSTIINESGARVTARATSDSALSGLATGVQLDKNASFFNAGTLKSDSVQVGTSAADTSFYMLNGASAGADTENGTMMFSGLGTVYLGGAKASDNTVSGLTSGSEINVTSNLSIFGKTLNLVDSVTLKMDGDFTVGDGVTTTWNGNSLTIDNGGTLHSFSMGNEFAGSWSGPFTLRENESGEGVTLTQQKADKYVSLNLGKVTVGGGVLRATETLELGGADTAMEIASDTDSLVLHGEHGGYVLNAVIAADGVMLSAGAGKELTLDSSTLTLGKGLNVLKNVVVQGSSHINSVLGSDLSLDLVTFVLDELNSSLGTQAVLAAEDDVALFMTPYAGGGTAMLGSNILENISVSGDLTLDLSYWSDAITEGGYDSIAFALGDGVDIAEGTQFRATFDGVNYASAAYTADNMVQFNVDRMAPAIPEPTTATLSLLALAGLAARCRRRAS